MFGFNEFGALGDGTNQNRNIPTLLTLGLDYQEGESAKFVDTGNGFSGLVTTHGRIFMWGDNRFGQLGDKTKTNRFAPVEITTHRGLLDGESFASLQLSEDSFSLFYLCSEECP
jgi:alpha-tubulin suppressor-like RCC1 family protein